MSIKKSLFIYLTACLLVLLCVGCAAEPDDGKTSESEEEIEYTEDYYDRLFLGEVVTDEAKRESIFASLTDININTEFIKDFAKIEDESGEEKYSFTYRDNPFIVYMDEDSTVASVRVGEDGTDVYLKGYEPYDADDYIMTESRIQSFQSMMINAVEIAFDYPEIYELSDFSYKHEGDFYYMNGTVLIGEAKKAHSMEFVCYYEEAENTMHWYSLNVDGESILLEAVFEEPVIEERQPLSGE